MVYYWFAALTVAIASFVLSPFLYGTQILFFVTSGHFWWAVCVTGVLNVGIYYCFNKALRYGDISVVSVMQCAVPVITIPVSYVLHDLLAGALPSLTSPRVSAVGAIGIAVIVASSVANIIHAEKKKPSGAPVHDWLAQHPAYAALFGMAFASVAINFDKVAVDAANPFLMGVAALGIVAVVSTVHTALSRGFGRIVFVFKAYAREGIVVGLIYGVTALVMDIALYGHNVNYVVAIKRMSVVFATLYGLWVLREARMRSQKMTRLAICAGMVVGSVVVVLAR
jgi:drug/metabolite transporter (DMT)-like permease